jgi:hypothetical protein
MDSLAAWTALNSRQRILKSRLGPHRPLGRIAQWQGQSASELVIAAADCRGS